MSDVFHRLLLSLPVHVCSLPLDATVPPPHPIEAAQVARAVAIRKREFAVGRYCARTALAELGLRDAVIPSGSDRAPVWPAGVVGSITHTRGGSSGLCAAAVASSRNLVVMGLDAEDAEPLSSDVADFILNDDERRQLTAYQGAHRDLLATVVFSAKEAVYKALYPRIARVLHFSDVEVRVDQMTFEARLLGAAAELWPSAIVGRWAITDGFVATAAWVRAQRQ